MAFMKVKSLVKRVQKVFDEESETEKRRGVVAKQGQFVVLAVDSNGDGAKRFVVDLKQLTNPAFLRLLKMAEEEFGFEHNGVIKVPCTPSHLKSILQEGCS